MSMSDSPKQPVPTGEQCFVLDPISWSKYEAILNAIGDQPKLRATYLDGRLTLSSPTRRHDWSEKAVGRLVEAIAEGFEIVYEVSGHTTYRLEAKKGGVEGDQAYYFGANARRMSGPVDVDLSTQPPPDLAIEVEATHPADDSVEVWGRIGVPEVWRLKVDQETLWFGVRQPDGSYQLAPRSLVFPFLEPADVLGQLRIAGRLGWAGWVRQLGDWVDTTLLPRRGI